MDEENKISYYSVIPATVLFCEELKPNEKLLYAAITSLANKEGYCYASNSYLGKLFKATDHAASIWVNDLKRLGFVDVEILKDSKGNFLQRRIYPNDRPYVINNTYPSSIKNTEAISSKVSIIENVKNLTSKRFKNEFDSILKDLSDLGYNNYWQVLNAKDYGIPQNRERVFIISIRKDIDNGKFIFPEKIQLQLKLKDLLEEVVDNKYYLTEKGIGRLIKRNNKLIRNNENPDVSSCIIAGYHKMDGRNNQYISEENKPKRIGGIYDTDERKRQAGGNYDPNAISPTLTTMFPGGDKQPFVLVNEGTKKGSSEAREGDSINISYPNNMKKRGRVGKGVSQTILTSPNMAVVENANKPICLNANKKVSIQDRIYDEEGISATVTASEFRSKVAERKMFNLYNDKEIKDIAPTQTTNCGSSTSSAAVLISENGSNYLKIRKLTPLECWRLMGFDDEDFYKAKNVGISDTQLYRQAGNSIVVNVLEEIFKTLLNLKLKNE